METINGVIYVEAREWWDKSAGNSYFSARVWVNGELVAGLPFQYGYGSQFEYEAVKVLRELSPTLTAGLSEGSPLWRLRDFGVVVHTVKYEALKGDTMRWGVI